MRSMLMAVVLVDEVLVVRAPMAVLHRVRELYRQALAP